MKDRLNKAKEILVWLIVIFAIGMVIFTLFSVMTFDQNDRSVFGYRFFISRSDSMSATDFSAGDIIFVKNIEPETLQEGDVIAYTSQNDFNYGETVTHKIREVTTDENGEPGFITYGTTTDTNDEAVVTYQYVLGKYVGKIPKLGTFFAWFKTIPGYIICILIPFLLLIGYHGRKCVILFRQYKKEQMEEMQAEREKIAEEKRQSEDMMRELQELREKLAAKGQPVETVQNAQRPQVQEVSQPVQRVQNAPVQQPQAPQSVQRETAPQPQQQPPQPAHQTRQQVSQPVQQHEQTVSRQEDKQRQPAPTHRINVEDIFKSK